MVKKNTTKPVLKKFIVSIEQKKNSCPHWLDGTLELSIQAKNKTVAKKTAKEMCKGFLGMEFKALYAVEEYIREN
jgi:hypothetical protein